MTWAFQLHACTLHRPLSSGSRPQHELNKGRQILHMLWSNDAEPKPLRAHHFVTVRLSVARLCTGHRPVPSPVAERCTRIVRPGTL